MLFDDLHFPGSESSRDASLLALVARRETRSTEMEKDTTLDWYIGVIFVYTHNLSIQLVLVHFENSCTGCRFRVILYERDPFRLSVSVNIQSIVNIKNNAIL